MRDFEKRLALKLKEEAARIAHQYRVADIERKSETENGIQCFDLNSKVDRQISRRRRVVSAAIVAFLLISILGIDYFFENKGVVVIAFRSLASPETAE